MNATESEADGGFDKTGLGRPVFKVAEAHLDGARGMMKLSFDLENFRQGVQLGLDAVGG